MCDDCKKKDVCPLFDLLNKSSIISGLVYVSYCGSADVSADVMASRFERFIESVRERTWYIKTPLGKEEI